MQPPCSAAGEYAKRRVHVPRECASWRRTACRLLFRTGVSSPALTAAQAKVRAYARGVDSFCQRHRRAVIGLAIVAASGVAVSGYFLVADRVRSIRRRRQLHV